jgi:tripartite motif-containing protein 71
MDETRHPVLEPPCPRTGAGPIRGLGTEAARGSRRVLLGGIAAGAVAGPAQVRHDVSAKKKKKKPKGCGQPACFVRSWGSEGSQNGYFYYPTGITVSPANGDLYVADYGNHRVQQFSASGEYLGAWGSEGSGNGQFDGPRGIAFRPNGDIVVSDEGNYRVQLFAEGTYLRQWGGFGTNPGQFNGWPGAVAVASSGDAYVTAAGFDDRVHRFDPSDGAFISRFGGTGSGNGQLIRPSGIAIAANGDVLVADSGNHRIQRFRADGESRGQWGTLGTGNGQFNEPAGITVAEDGTIYVADSKNDRIQRFDANGAFLGAWGSTGAGNGQMHTPWDVAVHNNQIYVTELYGHRVQQFALAAPPKPKKRKNKRRKKH